MLLALLTVISIAASAAAFNGFTMRMPSVGFASPKSGLALELDANWFNSGGYRPIQVRFTATVAKSFDREVALKLYWSSRNGVKDAVNLTVSKGFTIPAGQTTAEGVIRMPGYNESGFLWCDVVVDGKADASLSIDRKAAQFFASPAGEEIGLKQLKLRDAGSGTVSWLGRRSMPRQYQDLDQLMVEDAVSEPCDQWLDYSSADIVRTQLSMLRIMAERDPAAIAALRRFALAGGFVWIENVEDEAEALNEITRLLAIGGWSFDLDTPFDATLTPVSEAEGWNRESLMSRPVSPPGSEGQTLGQDIRGLLSAALESSSGGLTSRGWYAVHGAGLGRVMAFPAEGFDIPRRISPGVAANASKRWVNRGWERRHGVRPEVGSPDFANLLIPGVGFAPVGEFQVLITLFVLAIGPLNYWLLWRKQRLDLLVITTPLGALLVTACLFVYATFSDGFGVRVRARGLTVINQPAGEAVTWARLCHYAGLGVRGEFSMPPDTMLYPIKPGWEVAVGPQQSESRGLAWEPDRQHLVSGWLPARTSAQHLLVRAGPFAKELLVTTTADQQVEVRNRLGADLQLLMVYDEGGQWWRGESINVDGVARLEAIDKVEAVAQIRQITLDNEPQIPLGAGRQIEDSLERIGASRSARRLQREVADVSPGGNLMNQAIDRLVGLEGGAPLNLPPRSYVALSTKTVGVPLGFESVTEAGSFHLTVGNW
ncbi:hypothetical protein [Botrimarina hoheduenensis]|uniref:Uncharacterized protein n=1 Tax=Botrimarina hoheduenensis TaxID=2528000 RepID=A0A5C5WGF6_9BACT|nr:hypothetical protein [Botrimarina hoheduenensis]TWT48862.1 hypothetical protein Pla111_06380 [Botrimarina hoheduenensis]